MKVLVLLILSISAVASAETCQKFADDVLSFYDLGTVGKPSAKALKYRFDQDKKTKLDIFNIKGKNGIAIYSQKGSVQGDAPADIEENSWRIVVNSNHVVEREKRRKFFPAGTWPKGPIRYVFYFQKEGGACVLEKVQYVRTGILVTNEEADFKKCEKLKKSPPEKDSEYILLHLCEQYFMKSKESLAEPIKTQVLQVD